MLKRKLTYYLMSSAIITVALFFAGSVSFILALNVQIPPTPSPTPTSTPTSTPSIRPKVALTSSPTPTLTPLPTPNPAVPSAVPASNQPATNHQTNTSVLQSTVNLNINEPDGSFNFSLNYHEGMNPCSMLNDAKNEGKIRSLTITHYDSLNSDYVKEMNGYQEGWTFLINGDSKLTGCSNYTLGKGDTVNWKYN